ncbi:MAG: hypothetical protein ACLGH8_08905 [Bacteroidia bacterium]|jgi:uncharacterized membrane protein
MKPFFVLISVFLTGIILAYIFTGTFHEKFCGRLALSIMLLFTAFGHFKFVKGMALMLPDFLPYKKSIIYITGIVEISFSILLWVKDIRYQICLALIVFLITIFPANIKAAFSNVNIEQGNHEGQGPSYLWFRIPLQFLLLFWVWVFCL